MVHFYICVGLVTCEVVNMDVGLVGSLPLVIFWSSSHCYWQHLMPGWGNQDDRDWLQPCQGWYDDDGGIIFGSFDNIAQFSMKYWQSCCSSVHTSLHNAHCTYKSPKLTQVHWQRTFLWCSPDSWSFQKQGRTCNRCPGRHSDRAIFTIISNIYKSTKYLILTKLIRWKDLYQQWEALVSTWPRAPKWSTGSVDIDSWCILFYFQSSCLCPFFISDLSTHISV